MGNSLRDELLKVGLVGEQRAENKRRSKRHKAGPGKKRKQAPVQSPSEPSVSTATYVLRENRRRTARFVRDSTLSGGSVAENAKKAQRRKIQDSKLPEKVKKDRIESINKRIDSIQKKFNKRFSDARKAS